MAKLMRIIAILALKFSQISAWGFSPPTEIAIPEEAANLRGSQAEDSSEEGDEAGSSDSEKQDMASRGYNLYQQATPEQKQMAYTAGSTAYNMASDEQKAQAKDAVIGAVTGKKSDEEN